MMSTHYDIIGDVHGNAAMLETLLQKLGYTVNEQTGYYAHPERKAIFLGDLIDRGEENFRTLAMVKGMVDSGSALMVMGNHEYNALCYHTVGPDGEFLRPHNTKNWKQHNKVLDEIEQRGKEEWCIYLEWFRRLPLFLEMDGIRIIHACWNQKYINFLKKSNIRDAEGRLTDQFLVRTEDRSTEEFQVIDILLKGEEIRLPADYPGIMDKDGNLRKKLRFRWWMSEHERQSVRMYDEAVRTHDGALKIIKGIEIPVELLGKIRANTDSQGESNTPVFFGHYWFTGDIKILNEKAACLDYSVGLGGPLVCYRWDGEQILDSSKLVFHEAPNSQKTQN